MAKIKNECQYDWAVARVEALLPVVTDGIAFRACGGLFGGTFFLGRALVE